MTRDVLNIQASSTASENAFFCGKISNRRAHTFIGGRHIGDCSSIHRLDSSGS
ncbi:hypothetical protein RND71_012618 [Anisodus tanguticus]|uniref:Uncharacterized protein n=1 Tax=Anisodus tanguticus TaxID=243964 RepID=A0AAE1SHE1_9SOLA|nr:hypothetical protein RND71_012618 [Anisodus tanguticus]